MRVLTAVLPLAGSYVRARISLKQAISAVGSLHDTAGGAQLHAHPEGPLNILRAHAAVNNDAIAKKRMFSPTIHACYALKEAANSLRGGAEDRERKYEFQRTPVQDEIWDCTGSEKVDGYLHAYYSTLKVLFRVVDDKAVVSTNHHLSFYKYTRVQLSDGERARFFAALLMLANGEKGIKATYRGRAEGSKAHQGREIFGVALTGGKSTLVDLSFTILNTLPGKKTLYIEEMRAVVNFFVEHGATNVEEYELDYTDSPSFLIQAYLCEYANDDAFIGEVFSCVGAFLAEMYSGIELDAARCRYFTADKKLVGEYSEKYGVLTEIDKISSRGRFPFTSSNMPLETDLVHYYDETAGEASYAVGYSDCVEIALYNFLCCVLYDPEARSYSTEHLKKKKCEPTERLLHFFTSVCSTPEDNSKACIHQEWARVAQGLTRPPAADSEMKVAANERKPSLIKYCKTTADYGSVGLKADVALKADIGTFLVALAEVVGLPAEKKKNLEDAVGELLALPPGDVGCVKLTQLLNDVLSTRISTRQVELELRDVQVGVDKEEDTILSGLLVLSFPPQKDDQACYEVKFKFGLEPRHVGTAYTPNDVVLSEGEREIFAPYDEGTANDGGCLLFGLINDCARRFLNKIDGTVPPNGRIAALERAQDPKALYTALTRWLSYVPMRSHPDRLGAIDQLFPTFVRLLKQGKGIGRAKNTQAGGSATQNRTEGHSPDSESKSGGAADMVLSAQSPLVLLIANILGSASLNDAETRNCFLRSVLPYCVSDRAKLFPSIHVQRSLYCRATYVYTVCPAEASFWRWAGFRVPNITLGYLRQLVAPKPVWSIVSGEKSAIWDLFEHLDNAKTDGAQIVNMFMAHRHTEGIEFARSYCVLDSSVASSDSAAKRVLWFRMALKNRVYSEVRRVCSGWDERGFAEFMARWAEESPKIPPSNLPPLSDRIVARIFPDGPSPVQLRVLQGLYV
ncbi:hypothetical protein PAPHI01_0313 [Pancytospora philotis]|nr:hypothetical protein PAPHI01_0313 [Pancytospora philotis]